MECFEKNQYNKGSPLASVNEALLDEFFSIISDISKRITKESPSVEKSENTKPEGDTLC